MEMGQGAQEAPTPPEYLQAASGSCERRDFFFQGYRHWQLACAPVNNPTHAPKGNPRETHWMTFKTTGKEK